jgi:D-alanyl-D-alanine carboxypeptidase
MRAQIRGKGKLLTQEELVRIFGTPNKTGAKYLTTIVLPYLMWYEGNAIKTIQCHKLIANNLLAVFTELLQVYGIDKLNKLGITNYGGCFNYRLMRNSRARLSTHSWGIAIDLDPNRNTLKENHLTATFARQEYGKMIDIFYKYGFVSLGVEKDFDWMHFQHSGQF